MILSSTMTTTLFSTERMIARFARAKAATNAIGQGVMHEHAEAVAAGTWRAQP
jgi:hypothetical protein